MQMALFSYNLHAFLKKISQNFNTIDWFKGDRMPVGASMYLKKTYRQDQESSKENKLGWHLIRHLIRQFYMRQNKIRGSYFF
jgi:hypothetical protein